MLSQHKINKDKTNKNKISLKFKSTIKLSLRCYQICRKFHKINFYKGFKEIRSFHRNN